MEVLVVKNMTLQLFEYLLAAQKSNLSVYRNLNKYPAYWFFDEILAFKHLELERITGKGISIQLQKPVLVSRKIEVSAPLEAILDTLEPNCVAKEIIPVSTVELEKTLSSEVEAIMLKLLYPDQEMIIANDWQQILIGVSQPKVLLEETMPNEEDLKAMVTKLISEYQSWQDAIKEKEIAQAQFLKEKAFYDEILFLYSDADVNKKMNLGVGLLHIPGKSSVYHPLLTLDIEVFVDAKNQMCEFIFEQQILRVDTILEQVLFYDIEGASSLRNEINAMRIDPFDEESFAIALEKIIKYIHPRGNYFASPVDAMLATDNLPQILGRSVLFIREEQAFNGEAKLRPTIEYLSKNHMPSDVISSIVSPDFMMAGHYDVRELEDDFFDPMFIWQTNSPERKISTFLAENPAVAIHPTVVDYLHPAVAVGEGVKKEKLTIIANLVTYLVATGKRILVVGEVEEELDELQVLLPQYLADIYSKIPSKKANFESLSQDLKALRNKLENDTISEFEADRICKLFETLRSDLYDVIAKMVDYRVFSSENVNWQGNLHHPNELAEMIAALGGDDGLAPDVIPLDMAFEISDEEIEYFWRLRPYFLPENMALLNYDFVDLNALNDHHEYQTLLEIEDRYFKLSDAATDQVKEILDETIDIRFAQYLFDQLPELMSDVAKIDTIYGNKILRKSLENPEAHRELTKTLKDSHELIVRMETDQTSADEKKACVGLLNEMLDVAAADLLLVDIQASDQLIEFYVLRRSEMMHALNVAHLILIFNEGAKALSKSFAEITSTTLEMMDILYGAATLHLCKVELEIYWLRVKSHFIRVYQPIIHQSHVHPACLELFEALQLDHVDEFKKILAEITELVVKRQAFVTFGEFMDQVSVVMPAFTASVMSGNDYEKIPNFKEAFIQGQLRQFLEQFQVYDPEFLEQEIDRLKDQLLKLQYEILEIECYRKFELIDRDELNKTIELLENERPTVSEIDRQLILLSQIVFMPLRENNANDNFDPNLFDLTIFIDASRSNIIRISELVHSHKALIFGNEQESPLIPLRLREDDDEKLKEKFGENMQKFGEIYFESSLFDLMANSAAWEAQVELPVPMNKVISNYVEQDEEFHNQEWETKTHQEIFDILTNMGYDLRINVEINHAFFDFLVVGQSNVLALNVLGCEFSSREKIEQQLKKEIELSYTNLNMYAIQSVQFHLESNQTMIELYDHLARLNIYPTKNK